MTHYANSKGGRHYAAEYRDNENSVPAYLPALIFVGFIFTMAIWFLFNPKLDYSSSEKRNLQQFPETSVNNITSGKFGKEFETYFADHFPARNMWVGANAYASLLEGNNGAKDVYNCKYGYLINKPVSEDNEIKNNIDAIVDFKNLDAVKNTPMSVMLAPSTGYVCDDVLPSIHNEYKDDKYFPEITSTLSQNGISFVDLRDTFKSAYKAGSQLYYRTDHHWTTRGAYTAYTRFCSSLGITPAKESVFNIEHYGGFYGTTYSTSGFWLTQPDDIEVWNNKSNTADNLHMKITEGTETKDYDSMFFYNHLEEDDKYPVFIDGNHAYTEITNTKAEKGTLLVIKDSFSHSIAPFLAESYKKVILIDMRYFKTENVSAVVQREKPDQLLALYGIDNLANDTDLVWLQ